MPFERSASSPKLLDDRIREALAGLVLANNTLELPPPPPHHPHPHGIAQHNHQPNHFPGTGGIASGVTSEQSIDDVVSADSPHSDSLSASVALNSPLAGSWGKSEDRASRKSSREPSELAAEAMAEREPPRKEATLSDARLLYRRWRTGSNAADETEFDSSPTEDHGHGQPQDTGRPPVNANGIENHQQQQQTQEMLGMSPPPSSSPPAVGLSLSPHSLSPKQLPRIPEKKSESSRIFANSYDPDEHARVLSEQLSLEEKAPPPPVHQVTSATGGSAGSAGTPSGPVPISSHEAAAVVAQLLGGSYSKSGGKSDTHDANLTMRKARSYQALADLEKTGYFPAAPKPPALGAQRVLKDSVVNDMCRAVVKHMVGDVYVSSSSQLGSKKVVNHLYEPVLQSVQHHFKRLPARYALSVNPDDVPVHMRLLARHHRHPEEICVNVQLKKDDDGSIVPNVCEVVVVCTDRDNLLDAITRALTGMKGSIMDADVMTTNDSVTLDRFVVRGKFMTDDRQTELRNRIEENLSRLSMEAEQGSTLNAKIVEKNETGIAEKLGVLKMVDQKEMRAEWKLDINEIRLEKAIGNGRSGQTYSAWWRGTRVAVKVVDSSSHNDSVGEDLLNEFHREVAVVSKLRHPNIVLFLGAAIAPPRYCLVFEFMQNGTLTDLIRSRKILIDFFQVAREIAMGMNYLHLCSIMHRDLKSGNVLLDAHGTVKISDFGLSCVLDIGSCSDLTAETGTYRWMAPEVIRHEPYSNKADVYSFGVVLWEMIAKDQPFRGMTPIQAAFAVARQQMRPALPRYTPIKLGELVEHCWHQDPLRRPSFSDILEALPLVKMSLKKRDFKHLGFVGP